MEAAAAISSETCQYVTLGIGQEVFAISVASVREILEPRPLCRIPNAPSFLLGIIDVRNQSVPVIDLRIKLGLDPIPPTEHSRILVLDVSLQERPLMIGLLVDSVFEVAALDEQSMEAPPEIGQRWQSDFIAGVGRREGNFVIVFDVNKLLSGDETILLGREEAA